MSKRATVAVGLVRGINVGPTTGVAMTDLTDAFEASGFEHVKTLLRSGNVIFTAPAGVAAAATATVERELLARSGVSARVLLLTAEAFARASAANPLVGIANDHSKLVVTYLAESPDLSSAEVPDPASIAPEVLQLGEEAIYQWCPLGVSKSKLTARFWRQFGPVATARNWRTVEKILAEVESREGA
jgi:uncharacterized protein (DUF1697 family)